MRLSGMTGKSIMRIPAVAGQFYPGDAKSLIETLSGLIPDIPTAKKIPALAVISPHAGYIYSGAVAGETFAQIQIPRDIIIIGPNHHGYGSAVSLMDSGTWEMPCGNIDINEELADLIAINSNSVERDQLAHRLEHSLEVQVPFLQYLRSDIRITPLGVSHISFATCLEVGSAIARAIKAYAKAVLIVASTDMTHYESRNSATRKDGLAMVQIKKLNPQGLYNTVTDNNITMCGIIPTTITLAAAMALGAAKAELIRYTDSGETSGDTSQVVGYAGFVIS